MRFNVSQCLLEGTEHVYVNHNYRLKKKFNGGSHGEVWRASSLHGSNENFVIKRMFVVRSFIGQFCFVKLYYRSTVKLRWKVGSEKCILALYCAVNDTLPGILKFSYPLGLLGVDLLNIFITTIMSLTKLKRNYGWYFTTKGNLCEITCIQSMPFRGPFSLDHQRFGIDFDLSQMESV